MTKSRKFAYLALLVATIIWGIAPPVIKWTLGFISPINFLFYRFLFASIIVIIPLFWKIRKLKPSKKDWFWYIFLGFLCTPLNLLLLFFGIQKTTAIDASLISITAPFFIFIGGALFLKETVTKTEKIGIGLAIAGTLLTISQPFFEKGLDIFKSIEGNIFVFLGTLVWVVFILLAKKHRHLDPIFLSLFSFIVGLIVITPFVLLKLNSSITFNFELLTLNSNALWGVLFMVIFSSVIAYSTHLYGLSKIEASETGIFTYLQPLFAVPISFIFLHEKITVPFLLGAVLIASGVFFSASRPEKG